MQNIRHRRANSDRRLRPIEQVFHLMRTAPPRNPTPTMASRQRTPTLTTHPINTYFLPTESHPPLRLWRQQPPQQEQPPHQTTRPAP
ncbi:hypothetical protein IV203_024372 [Nitzschia inconspicua]|uniref:Uncharacterized protein n=1 Tax=Nitzschia inconspicua TaxID=303405 RepID=A0A9K3PD87_9STRA|nr:hypothetical protein IV203_024372 [Nitzschia inconspicua]